MSERIDTLEEREKTLKAEIEENRATVAKLSSRLLIATAEEITPLIMQRLEVERREEELNKSINVIRTTISEIQRRAKLEEDADEIARKKKIVEQVKAKLPACPRCGKSDLVELLGEPHGNTSNFWTEKTAIWFLPMACNRPRCRILWNHLLESPERNPTPEEQQLS